jgi:hypothetical protein
LKANEELSIDKFISASAIGYYGMYTGDTLLQEESPAGEDFLAEVVIKWEAAADQFKELGIPVSKLRVGVVLSIDGGALPQLAMPIKLGFGAALGSGKQLMSWIHIDDICEMFIHIVDKNLVGTYNGVAPEPVNNQQMTKEVAQVLSKPLWLPKVPAFAMKLALGEMAGIVLGGNKVSADKIRDSGYKFKFSKLGKALSAIYSSL